jgi:hypothetical protein
MRTFEYRFHFALALLGLLSGGQSLAACEPPPGFVNPPLPKVGPLEGLLSHTEEKDVALPLAEQMKSAARPLEEAIRPTKDLPGVSGTFRLSNGPFGTVGARRLVCLTDGNTSVEEVLLTESTGTTNRFRYVVWNYTNPKFRDVEYAVGEFIRTQPAPDQTHVNWTYRFALKEGRDPEQFRKTFLDTIFAEWMRNVFGTARPGGETAP